MGRKKIDLNAASTRAPLHSPLKAYREWSGMAIYNDYLHRKAVFNALNDIGGCGAPPESWADGWDKAIDAAIEAIEKLPNADVEPVKHGEWVYGEFDIPHCSECGNEIMPHLVSNYCPNCGAKMGGEESG